ncbi:hypothetical protein JCM8547_000510 [Rhodosporidiobolus lusitaniae]
MASSIPAVLPILPLPPDHIVLPGLTFSVHLTSRHSVELIRAIVKDASSAGLGSTCGSTPILVGCVPLRARATPENTLSAAANRAGKGEEGQDEEKTGEGANEPKEGDLRVLTIPNEGDKASERGKLEGGRPAPEELFEYGVASRIVRLERVSRGSGSGFVAVVEGLARFSFDPSTLDTSTAFYSTAISVYEPAEAVLPSSHGPLLSSLRSTTSSLLSTLSSTSTLPPLFLRQLRSRLTTLSLSSAPALVDAVIGTLPLSSTGTGGLTHADKLLILSLVDGVARVEQGIELFARVDEAHKLAQRIGERVDQSAQRRAREFALMQQLLAIRQELDELAKENKSAAGEAGPGVPVSGRGRTPARRASPRLPGPPQEDGDEEEDEMAELEKKIEAKAFSEEARKVAVREFKRLKKSPPQGAEHGVIRTYLETFLSIPWTSAESTPLPKDKDFIAKARKKLDDDHYGLEKIKKRLLEWLAVLRLQQEEANLALSTSLSSTPSSPSETAVPSALTPSTETAVVLRDPATPPAPSTSPSPSSSAPTVAKPPMHPAPILLLHGPPGTGKTSIARSLAEAMGRKFVRISLGGVRDEAEIRGHRRTYVGAMPGKIVTALKKAGTNNPVCLLDEIDKLSHDSLRGSPDAALLEVLDPSQNQTFEDHYLGIPLDLSQVLFICTANDLSTISEPLYDRCEPVELSGYVHSEKLHIARQSLLPKQLAAHALKPELFEMDDEVLLFLVQHYTREAGVRSLNRQLAAVCRAKAVEYAEAKERGGEGYEREVKKEDVERILGTGRWDPEEVDKGGNRVGVATGLAYQGSGNGGILHIETTHFPGSGKLVTTGQLGDVIQESASVAFAWVKAHAVELGIAKNEQQDVFKSLDVHLHLPAGSVKKDGPSAGVAMVSALVSLMLGIPTVPGVGMTGEITLRGAVTPVGGIKEKILAAHRAGLTLLVLPAKNKRDVDADVPVEVKDEVEFVYVERVEEALHAVFGGKVKVRERKKEVEWRESRL